MEKEKVMHVVSVLLDELAKNTWKDAVAGWDLSVDDGEFLVLKLDVYEGYNIPLSNLKEMVEKFEVSSCGISFRCDRGILDILINLSYD